MAMLQGKRAVTPFRNRRAAGRRLAERLRAYGGRGDVVVLALPRGGVPVGFEVAQTLGVPLDVFLVRKLGLPGREELAVGAIALGGVRVLNQELVDLLQLSDEVIEAITAAEQRELARRERLYRGSHRGPEVRGRIVILVDDGVATGSTMRAAAEALRRQGAARIVTAVPVAAPSVCEAFHDVVDESVCVMTPDPFYAVGLWYDDFSQTSDEEVRDLLARAEAWVAPVAPP